MIKRLVVQNLRGYREPELKLSFNSDLNLFTGRNGAGKTTILKLMWYLISGNIHTAAIETPFSFASIETDIYAMTVDLTESESPVVTLDINNREIVFRERTASENDSEDFVDLDDEVLERAGSYTEDYGDSLFFPTFRRVEGGYTIPRETRAARTILNRGRNRSALEEAFEEISRRLSNVDHRFVCSVSTSDIVSLVMNKFGSATAKYSSAQQALSNNIIEQIRSYENKDAQLGFEKADDVLTRIKRAIEHVDEQRVELMSSLNAVQDVVIQLFNHRGISFGDRYSFGDSDKAVLSENLSAGEKQMLSFICYNAFYDNATIFIDEPELSLHVDWQRQLFPILEAQATTNQFIVATHSPFIYSKYPEKEMLLGSDRGE